jgi:hypothetical protein
MPFIIQIHGKRNTRNSKRQKMAEKCVFWKEGKCKSSFGDKIPCLRGDRTNIGCPYRLKEATTTDFSRNKFNFSMAKTFVKKLNEEQKKEIANMLFNQGIKKGMKFEIKHTTEITAKYKDYDGHLFVLMADGNSFCLTCLMRKEGMK